MRASGVGWRTEEANEHKQDRDRWRGARARRANTLLCARSGALAAAASMERRRFESRTLVPGVEAAHLHAARLVRGQRHRVPVRAGRNRGFKRERACASPLPGQDAMQVCVCVKKHRCGLVGERVQCAWREGGRATRTVRHGCSCWPSSWAAASSGRHAHGRVSERVVRVPRQAVRVGWDVCARRGSGAGEIEERRGPRLDACASSAGRAMSKAAPCASEDEHAECATSVHVCGRYLRSCSAGALVQATDGACR